MKISDNIFRTVTFFTALAYATTFVVGCGGVSTVTAKAPQAPKTNSKSPLSVTLIDNREKIENPVFKFSENTITLDMRDPIFEAIKGVISANYSHVEIAKEAKADNQIYAEATVNTRRSDLSSDGGIASTIKISFFDHERKEKLSTISATVETQFKMDKVAIAASSAAMLATGLVLAPVSISIIQEKTRSGVEASYSQHLNELSVALNEKIQVARLDSLGGQTFALNESLDKRTNKITQAQRDSSVTRAEACKRDIPWQPGSALKRVTCLNEAWNDYTVFVESYVDEFKSYRAGLARQVDSGEIGLDDYDAQERKARDKLVWHTTITDGFKRAERDRAPSQKQGDTASQKKESSSEISNSAPEVPSYRSTAGADLMGSLTAVLGFAFQVAMIAAPYVLGYRAGIAAGYNLGYRNANAPRMVTCTSVSPTVSSCF